MASEAGQPTTKIRRSSTSLDYETHRDRRNTEQFLSTTVELASAETDKTSPFNNEMSQTEPSETSFMSSYNLPGNQSEKDIIIQMRAMDADQWEWDHVKVWLKSHNYADLIEVFLKADEGGIDGDDLLRLQFDDFMTDYNYKGLQSMGEIKENAKLKRLIKQVTKLKLDAESDENLNKQKEHADVGDYFEIKRRLHSFQKKWDKILWIDYYLDKYDERPSAKVFGEEQGVSMEIAKAYLKIHSSDKDKLLSKDLDELLMGFNPYNDCVLFWSIIISLLKLNSSPSLLMVFARVAEMSPGSVAIKLLNKYKLELSRFETEQVDKITQNVVIGSKYPVCAALRLSEWFKDRASYDVSRAEEWQVISESYIEAAVDYLSNLRSDHFATVLLECKSDIENRSALDMALDYRLTSFVRNNRVERVSSSIMNDFEFLKPENINEAFEIDELTLSALIDKLEKPQFYFTPLGTFITELALYLVYLGVFTYLSINEFRVYEVMEATEIVFWVLNMGYVFNEIQAIVSDGFDEYFEEAQNYMDIVISFLFVLGLVIRIIGSISGAPCVTPAGEASCYGDSGLYIWFIILWSLSTMLLWMRLFTFMILSHSLGPMVQMIIRMMKDIATFFKIMLVLFMGFSMCLMYVLKDVHEEFSTPLSSILTLLRAILGDFDFGAFAGAEDVNDALLYFGVGIMLIYLVIGSLVFLNLLIAMMAKTFDTIQDDTTSAIVFSRFQMALIYDNNATFMPAPLNVAAFVFFGLFYLIEACISCCVCCNRDAEGFPIDFAIIVMPKWMKRRNLEIDDQIVDEDEYKWKIETNLGDETPCKITGYRQEIMRHNIEFKQKVCVGDSIMVKKRWLLDLWELQDDGAINLDQFKTDVDREWTHNAHKSMREEGSKSPYWICRYCRGYVKRSNISIKRLGRLLQVSDLEMKLILSHAPEICPNCYRVRQECERWELVAEIISARMFEPVRWILLHLLRAIAWILKNVFKVADENDNDDEDTSDEEDIESEDCVPDFIYKDTMLLQQLNKFEADSDDDLWQTGEENVIWKTLIKAQSNVDDSLLKKKIEGLIMSKSIEDDHSYFEFADDFVEFDEFMIFDENAWNVYFSKFSVEIFKRIKEKSCAKQPLQLFARYPFDVHMVLDEFDDWWEKKDIVKLKKLSIKDCDADNVEFRQMLKELNLFNSVPHEIDLQLDIILDDVQNYNAQMRAAATNLNEMEDDEDKKKPPPAEDLKKQRSKNVDENRDRFYDKFVHYLYRVQSLFQNPRKLNNLLRDAQRAIVERGIDEYVFEDELYLLFEDISDASEAIPFFNAMRAEQFGDEYKVALWTLLNTLKCLYFLHHTVKQQVLTQNARIYVDKEDLLNLVFTQFKYDFVDPDGIWKEEEDSDSNADADDEEEEEADDEKEEEEQKETENLDEEEKKALAEMANAKKVMITKRSLIKRRLALFSKSVITAKAIKREICAIYDKITLKRREKVTVTNIDYYRRRMSVKLLQDEVSMNYIVNQLSRYATFNKQESVANEVSFADFYEILTNTMHFGANQRSYRIDEQMIPKYCRNLSFVRQLFSHMLDVYNCAAKEFNDDLYSSHPQFLTLLDVLSIILIYDRVFEETDKQMDDIADTFTVSHDVFCQFIDRDFKIGASTDSIGAKAQIASDLFQSVLDVQQNFVTLGEAYETILKFINDIDGMKCGEPFRIMSWIKSKKEEELNLYESRRRKWEEKHENKKSENENEMKLRENPAISFDHIDRLKWKAFVSSISAGLIDNKPCDDFLDEMKENVIEEEEEEEEEEKENKEFIATIYEFCKLDVISDDIQIQDKNKNNKDENDSSTRTKVFQQMFQFNADRITLQQFFDFSYTIYLILQRNKKINDLMTRYKKYQNNQDELKEAEDDYIALKREMKHEFKDFAEYYRDYFVNAEWSKNIKLKKYKEEIEWFYDGTRSVRQLCRRLFPFWSLDLTCAIHEFLESSDLINGTYELREAEFTQFKHELNVNDALAEDLFHLIRFKRRSLSWDQCRRYFAFLLQQRYRIKKAIIESTELEDTTISKDALKTELEISANDEAVWLFDKVQEIHGAKVTWKQVRNYLEKMVSVRASMRDFFSDQQRDRDFEENQAEQFHQVMENQADLVQDAQDEIKELKDAQKQVLQNQAQILKALQTLLK